MELELKVTWAEMLKVLVGSLRHIPNKKHDVIEFQLHH